MHALETPVADIPPELEHELQRADYRVWIDQDLCTGDGLCVDDVPEVFVILEDGIAYVREGERTMNDPGGATGLARVAAENERAVISATQNCPGECIFIEPIDRS